MKKANQEAIDLLDEWFEGEPIEVPEPEPIRFEGDE